MRTFMKLGFSVLLAVTGCSQKTVEKRSRNGRSAPETDEHHAVQHDAGQPGPSTSNTGELSPHFGGKDYVFVGDFHGTYLYVRPNATRRLRNQVFVADTFLVTEEFSALAHDPATGRFAAVKCSGVERKSFKEAQFVEGRPDSIVFKAWQELKSPQADKKTAKQGKDGRSWLYVGVDPALHSVYVNTAIHHESDTGIDAANLLFVKTQRCMLFFDTRTNRFAPVNTDMFCTPQEGIEYTAMRDGGMETEVWALIKDRLPPE